MKVLSNDIKQFVNDFNLETKKGAICFNAIILFSNQRSSKQLESEVQIISNKSTSSTTIHLLHPDVEAQEIPSIFNDTTDQFKYYKSLCLIIKGFNLEAGKYVISVHPEGKNCTDKTLHEIHQKTFN